MKLNELFRDACLYGALENAHIIHINHPQKNIHAIVDNSQVKNPTGYYSKLDDNEAMHSLLACNVVSITFDTTEQDNEIIYFAVEN